MNIEEFKKKIRGYNEPISLGITISLSNYIDAIKVLMDEFSTNKNIHLIYISATIPSRSISNILEIYGVDENKVFYVDCISHLMMNSTEIKKNAVYVESPTMLENIMLKTQYILNKHVKDVSVVVIDSINSLAIHNDMKILSEFLHLFVTFLRSRNSYMVILSIKEQTTQEIMSIMNFVSDETLEVD
jgi:archaellum biogenesis ATPase FlaH